MKKIAIKSNYTILLKFAETNEDMDFKVGENIIVEDYNGKHLVKVVMNEVDPSKNCDFKIIRKADASDLQTIKNNEEKCEKAQMLCNQYVKELMSCQHHSDHEDADIIIARFVEELGYTELAHLYRACPKWFS